MTMEEAAEAGDIGSAANRDRVAGLLDTVQRRRARSLLRRHALELDLPAARLAALDVATGETAETDDDEERAPPELVAAVQQALADLGYEAGDVDGVAGSRTRAAIADFARGVGMERAPPIGVDLLTRLQATRAARAEASRALRSEALLRAGRRRHAACRRDRSRGDGAGRSR